MDGMPGVRMARRLQGHDSGGHEARLPEVRVGIGMDAPAVFPSMCDPFEDNRQVANWRGEFLKLIETPNLDWLLLTKRPEDQQPGHRCGGEMFELWLADSNVWLGTSAEDQVNFDSRVAALINNGWAASVRFLSVEPMLGPVRIILPLPACRSPSWIG